MPAADLAPGPAAPAAPPGAPAFRQFPVAWRFSLRNQARNRLAWLLLVAFVPVWYELMLDIAGHAPLTFKLYATGRVLTVDGGHLTLITAGLNAVTMIVGFAVFAAIRRTLAFDKRLVFAGYRQATLITAKTLAIAVIAAAVAAYTSLVLLAFWRPGLAGWAAILAAFTVIALAYGALGLLLGVLVRNDLEGFFLIIMGSLMDTFLQNPLGNPAGQQAGPAMVPVLRPHPVRRRRRIRPHRPVGLPGPRPGLARSLRRRGPAHLPGTDPHPDPSRPPGSRPHVRTGHAIRKHAAG
ncbi:MAG: hypothetical protein ACLP8X_09355 [Streptosporangiaceae bacterium]